MILPEGLVGDLRLLHIKMHMGKGIVLGTGLVACQGGFLPICRDGWDYCKDGDEPSIVSREWYEKYAVPNGFGFVEV